MPLMRITGGATLSEPACQKKYLVSPSWSRHNGRGGGAHSSVFYDCLTRLPFFTVQRRILLVVHYARKHLCFLAVNVFPLAV
ncbi:hypothetical protein TNCV_3151161 [Trichonephila clavipes]|nr:hypothetical protein TNCV_3151161 [Trichonephila clavipes]